MRNSYAPLNPMLNSYAPHNPMHDVVYVIKLYVISFIDEFVHVYIGCVIVDVEYVLSFSMCEFVLVYSA